MSDLISNLKLLDKPIGHISDQWVRNIERRKELHRKLLELIIDTSVVGRHHKSNNQYQIVFSPSFYRHGQSTDGTKPPDMINRLVSILKEFGHEFPQFVPVLVRFKLRLKSYEWQSDDTLTINNLAEFDEGNNTFAKELNEFLKRDRQQASPLRKGLQYFLGLVAFPGAIAYLVFPFLLWWIANDIFQRLAIKYSDSFVIWGMLAGAVSIGYVVSFWVWQKL